MIKNKRQKGKEKKRFRKAINKSPKKLRDRKNKKETSAVVTRNKKCESIAVPLRTYISVYRKILSYLKPNNKHVKIKHREHEKEMLMDFVRHSFNFKNLPINIKTHPSVMIVFGQAGLGKTFMLHDILKELHQTRICDLLNVDKCNQSKKFISVYYFNSMAFDYPKDLLISILRDVFKRKINIRDYEDPGYYLQIFRKNIKRLLADNYIIILIDELDHLYYKCPKHFHCLIEFFNISFQGFVKIGIANTLNFVSNVSGTFMLLHTKFMIFKPYNINQLKDILLDRLMFACKHKKITWEELITPHAVELLVKKVISNNSSDVRFLLSCASDIISKKIELLTIESRKRNRASDVHQINVIEILELVQTKTKRKFADLIKNISFQHQLVLVSICKLMKQDVLLLNVPNIKKLYKQLLKNYNIDDKIDFNILLDNLVGYSFIKIYKDSHNSIIKSIISKKELVTYLSEIPIFKKEF